MENFRIVLVGMKNQTHSKNAHKEYRDGQQQASGESVRPREQSTLMASLHGLGACFTRRRMVNRNIELLVDILFLVCRR